MFMSMGPTHASCKLTWTFTADCATVTAALKSAISDLSGSDCGTSEKCLYKLTSSSEAEIKVLSAVLVLPSGHSQYPCEAIRRRPYDGFLRLS
jgi:L-cysteine desulfidase